MRQNKQLTAEAERCADIVLAQHPKNEHELLKTLREVGFTGYMVKRSDYLKCADVSAEIFSTEGNARGKIGTVDFVVPSCTTFYKRDAKGFIINIEYFGK